MMALVSRSLHTAILSGIEGMKEASPCEVRCKHSKPLPVTHVTSLSLRSTASLLRRVRGALFYSKHPDFSPAARWVATTVGQNRQRPRSTKGLAAAFAVPVPLPCPSTSFPHPPNPQAHKTQPSVVNRSCVKLQAPTGKPTFWSASPGGKNAAEIRRHAHLLIHPGVLFLSTYVGESKQKKNRIPTPA